MRLLYMLLPAAVADLRRPLSNKAVMYDASMTGVAVSQAELSSVEAVAAAAIEERSRYRVDPEAARARSHSLEAPVDPLKDVASVLAPPMKEEAWKLVPDPLFEEVPLEVCKPERWTLHVAAPNDFKAHIGVLEGRGA
eukprot:5214957-Alexandrium_andersonii.AAC.1